MTAVIGYLVVAAIAIGAALLVAGPHDAVRRDPTFELEKVSDRLVEILPERLQGPRVSHSGWGSSRWRRIGKLLPGSSPIGGIWRSSATRRAHWF